MQHRGCAVGLDQAFFRGGCKTSPTAPLESALEDPHQTAFSATRRTRRCR